MAVQMTKSQLIEKIAVENEVGKKDVKGVLETLATIGYKELKKNGVFLVPGFAKFVVIKKAATKARKGVNPFNGEPMTFKAKPARKIVRARPVKAAKGADGAFCVSAIVRCPGQRCETQVHRAEREREADPGRASWSRQVLNVPRRCWPCSV